MADGNLNFDTRIDTSGFQAGTKSIKEQATYLQSVFKKVGATIAAAFTVREIIRFGSEAINLASDLQEVQNVVDTAFGDMAYKMEEFAKTCITTYGMSKLTAKQMGSTFMAMAKGMGQATDIASDKAVELTGRLGDIMSFYNKTASEVNTIGKAIYSGETEPLKAIGIIMTETNLETYALAKGYKKLYSEMEAKEKLFVRQQYFLEQTSMAAGDFKKTQDSWANQTRILAEQWKEFMTILGNGLIQVLTPAVKVLNDMVASLIEVGTALSEIFGISLATETSNAQSKVESLGDTIEETQEKAKGGGTASFDELEVIGGGSSSDSSGSGLVETNTDAIKEETETTVEAEAATSELEMAIRRTGEALGWLGSMFETSFLGAFGNQSAFDSIIESFNQLRANISGVFTSPEVAGAASGFVASFISGIGSVAGTFAAVGVDILNTLLGGFNQNLEANKVPVQDAIVSMFDISSRFVEIGAQYTSNMLGIFGEIANSAIGAGTSIIDNLIGGFYISFNANKERVMNSVASLLDISQHQGEITANFSAALADIAEVFRSDSAKQITADIVTIFSNAALDTLEVLGTFGTDVLDVLTAPFIENKDEIGQTIEDTFSAVEPILKTFQTTVDEVFGAVKEIYDTSIKPLLESLKAGFTEIGAKLLEVYEQYILPVITYASEKFTEIAEGPIHDLIEKVKEFVNTAASFLMFFWNTILKPVIVGFIQKIVPQIAQGIKTIIDWVKVIAQYLSAMIGSVISNLGNLLNFFKTGFTEGWGKAWEELKTATIATFDELWNKMKVVINSILGGVESMANGVVKSINKLIDSMNELSFTIPDWVPGDLGGQTFGFDISHVREVSIPRLATGTVVPANYGEFAAILGDNKRETEVVSPLSTMKQALKEAILEVGGTGGGDIHITLEVEGETLHRVVVKQDRRYRKQTGKSAFAQ